MGLKIEGALIWGSIGKKELHQHLANIHWNHNLPIVICKFYRSCEV
jgi:hypothetical protein